MRLFLRSFFSILDSIWPAYIIVWKLSPKISFFALCLHLPTKSCTFSLPLKLTLFFYLPYFWIWTKPKHLQGRRNSNLRGLVTQLEERSQCLATPQVEKVNQVKGRFSNFWWVHWQVQDMLLDTITKGKATQHVAWLLSCPITWQQCQLLQSDCK